MYDYGRGVPQDDVEAAKWYRKAAEQGNDLAQNSLGGMYYFGKGVPQDYVEAAKWLQKADDQGHAFAQKKLVVMYAKGRGVPQDDVEAAEQRIAEAQDKLGMMYYEGQSVPQDDVEAYAWFLLAKANGIEKASEMISILEKRFTAKQMEKGQARAAELRRLYGKQSER